MRSLAAIMRNGDKDATRVAAAAILLDRGWGKPAQTPQTRTGGDGDVRVTIRTFTEGGDEICHRPDAQQRGPAAGSLVRFDADRRRVKAEPK